MSETRKIIVALAKHACNGEHGRNKDDLIYVEVTEGRDGPTPAVRKRYSSCGDLPHWIFQRLGIDQKWVNRKSLGHYTIGRNITNLCVKEIATTLKVGDALPSAGDILVVTGPEHTCVIVSDPHEETQGAYKVSTANYGAGGMSPSVSPGAAIRDSLLHVRDGRYYLGTRPVYRIIRAERLEQFMTNNPDFTGIEEEWVEITKQATQEEEAKK